MQEEDLPLDKKEKAALRSLYDGESSPPDVQLKLLYVMQTQGHISLPRPLLSASVPGVLTALLLAVLLAGGGFFLGKSQQAAPAAAAPAEKNAKPRFALLVRADDVPSADPSQQFREYSAWAQELGKDRFVGGEALHGQAWLLSRDAGTVQVQAQELKGGRDEISGYFLYEAENAEEALRIAQTCPHLNYQGTLELREILKEK